jgi:hypothetical protein
MLLEIVKRTPPWVWLVFGALLWLGIWQSRPRRVTRQTVLALPLAMIALSLLAVWNAFGTQVEGLLSWSLGALLLPALNQRLNWPRVVTFEPRTATFGIAGSWIPLGLMMVIFFTRYAVAVLIAMRPSIAGTAMLAAGASFVYGSSSGAFLARAMRILRAARSAAAVQLR